MAAKSTYHTKQQEELLNYLCSTPGQHHTVAQIRDHFSGGEQAIGMATIYRHLERYVSEGKVRKYQLETGDGACYEYVEQADACASHFHCKCVICGRLIHLNCDELQEIREHLLKEHGFAWDACRTVFYGVCQTCQQK